MPIMPSLQLIKLLEELTFYWEDCGYSRNYICRTLIPSIQYDIARDFDPKEHHLLSQIKKVASKEEWAHLAKIACDLKRYKEIADATMKQAFDLFERGKFKEAENLCKALGPRIYLDAKQKFTESIINRIVSLINREEFARAESQLNKFRELFLATQRAKLLGMLQEARRKAEERQRVVTLLKDKKFSAADQAFLASKSLTEGEYLQLKSTHIEEVLEQYGSDAWVNHEQAMALAHFSNRLLVTARAGSGKTRLLTTKTILLMDFDGVHPDNILVMAFNRDAAKTVKDRIKRLGKTDRTKAFENARTFHSLAYQIVQPSGRLLFDEKGEFVRKAFSEFVQSIFREIVPPEFLPHLYEFFRYEMKSAQSTGAFLDDNDYYMYLRNQRYSTLRGEKVKSIGEKFIADFLFEHNIGYTYEKAYLWDGRVYRPDFSLFINDSNFIIEHWGIDEKDPNKLTPEDWHQGWDGYYAEMQRKREYWGERSKSNGKKNFTLIETSVADLKNGREAFEDVLKSRLTNHGVVCKKLSEEERIQKVFRLQIDRMTNLLVQFILKAKKKRWNAAEVERQIAKFSNATAKTKFFLELGYMVYKTYEEKIRREGQVDFDELVNQAVQRIHSSKANLLVPTDGSASRQFNLSNLEWLLIDEYQDFSPLFYDLVDAIQKYNPNLKLLCVGDDWQAINSFAGSDLSYFTEYQFFFPNARVASLTTNYRSKSAIVDAGNKIMQGTGDAAKALPGNTGGNLYIDDVEAVVVQYKNGDKPENNPDVRYLFFDETWNGSKNLLPNSFMIGKYLKACHKIISSEQNRSKSFAILSRNNQIYGIDLADFHAKLISILREQAKYDGIAFEPNIKISTVHSFKGLEADCVVLLQVCQGYFPSIHPDNKLFEIFGQTEKMILDEEKRLFYVAVTRARESLFILTEGSEKSDFLSSIQAKSFLEL